MRGNRIRTLLLPLLLAAGLGACASNGVQPGIVYSSGAPSGAYGGGQYGSGPYGPGPLRRAPTTAAGPTAPSGSAPRIRPRAATRTRGPIPTKAPIPTRRLPGPGPVPGAGQQLRRQRTRRLGPRSGACRPRRRGRRQRRPDRRHPGRRRRRHDRRHHQPDAWAAASSAPCSAWWAAPSPAPSPTASAARGRGIEVTVQKDDGQQVTVAQPDDGDIQLGDRVQIVQNRQGVAQVVRQSARNADTSGTFQPTQ